MPAAQDSRDQLDSSLAACTLLVSQQEHLKNLQICLASEISCTPAKRTRQEGVTLEAMLQASQGLLACSCETQGIFAVHLLRNGPYWHDDGLHEGQ